MRPSDVEHDDRLSIDHKALSGREFRVSDVDVENIGITETVAVRLVGLSCESHDSRDERGEASAREDAETYVLTGTTADSAFAIHEADGGKVCTAFAQQIELDDS